MVNPRRTKPVLKEADVQDRFSKDFGKLLRTLYAWTPSDGVAIHVSPDGSMGQPVDSRVADPDLVCTIDMEWKTALTLPRAGLDEGLQQIV